MKQIEERKQKVESLALKHKWSFLDYQENIGLISFIKISNKSDQMRINIYLTKLTVATSLNHPKMGKTQLFRKHCTFEEIEKLFINPRQHSGKGYYTK